MGAVQHGTPSIYQVEPLGVVFPKHGDELQAVVEACARYGVLLLARGRAAAWADRRSGRR